MSKRIDKRLWGVLGKQQTYFSPQKQVEGKSKTPLNANAFDSWDAKRSRFKRVDGYENAIQQGGVVPQGTAPVPSPTPTPSITPSATAQPTPTPTNTNTPTPSITPSPTPDFTYRFQSLYFYPEDDTTNISGLTCCITVNGITGSTRLLIDPPGNWEFSGIGLTNTTSAQTANFIFSANPQGNYYLTGYPPNARPVYNEQRLTGFTYYQQIGNNRFWSGTTEFYNNGVLVGTEPGAIIQLNTTQKLYTFSNPSIPIADVGYFYAMPVPAHRIWNTNNRKWENDGDNWNA